MAVIPNYTQCQLKQILIDRVESLSNRSVNPIVNQVMIQIIHIAELGSAHEIRTSDDLYKAVNKIIEYFTIVWAIAYDIGGLLGAISSINSSFKILNKASPEFLQALSNFAKADSYIQDFMNELELIIIEDDTINDAKYEAQTIDKLQNMYSETYYEEATIALKTRALHFMNQLNMGG